LDSTGERSWVRPYIVVADNIRCFLMNCDCLHLLQRRHYLTVLADRGPDLDGTQTEGREAGAAWIYAPPTFSPRLDARFAIWKIYNNNLPLRSDALIFMMQICDADGASTYYRPIALLRGATWAGPHVLLLLLLLLFMYIVHKVQNIRNTHIKHTTGIKRYK